MENSLEVEREKIRGQLRDFFRRNGIVVEEDLDYIGIRGFLSNLEVSAGIYISLGLGEKRYLFIDFEGESITIVFKRSFEKGDADILKIQKSDLMKVYYFSNTVFFWV